MNLHKWFDRSQPQTLQAAVTLLYLDTALSLLSLLGANFYTNAAFASSLIITKAHLPVALSKLIFLVVAAAEGGSALGIANEKRWGYFLAVTIVSLALVELVLLMFYDGVGNVLGGALLSIIFEVAMFALLVHPVSRSYRKIWFK